MRGGPWRAGTHENSPDLVARIYVLVVQVFHRTTDRIHCSGTGDGTKKQHLARPKAAAD